MKKIYLVILFACLSMTISAQVDTTAGRSESSSIQNITITSSELESEEQSQDISGLLQSSGDIFVSTAGYTFGNARFRIRGYESENTVVMINGIPVNDMETDRAYWSTWGGLNDVTRNKEINHGITSNRNNFGGLGGATNILTRASLYQKGIKFTYSLANTTYRQRAMFTYSTGMMKNKWALTVSGSRRWAEEGYVEGTFYDAYSYFVSAERRINSAHSVGLVAFSAPTRRGIPGVATQEACDLAGTNYYNPYWGYQAGEKRNSRVSNYNKPLLLLNHYWDISKKTSLVSALSYSFGRGGSTAINWYDAYDPRPDYYRKLPSYWRYEDPDEYTRLTNLWMNDEGTRQLDWEHFYFSNRKNLYTQQDADGKAGNDITGNLAKYFLEDRRNDHSQIGFNSNFNHTYNDHIKFFGGLNIALYKGYHFKVMEDLLGADFWVDIDKFAEREFFDPNTAQADMRNPNRVIREGDKFGYNYTANINTYDLFGEAQFTYGKADFYLGATLTQTTFWRTGKMQNGMFPEDSYGDSEKNDFTNGGVKGGVTWKLTGRNFINANGAFFGRAPVFRTAYISPRTRDHVIKGLESEKIFSGDLSYLYRAPFLKARATLYYTEFTDQAEQASIYHDELNTFVNYIMTGVDKLHSGAEVGIEAKLTSEITMTGVFAMGEYIYNSRPKVTIAQDNDAQPLATNRTVYLENYRIGGTPETAASFGCKYSSPKYWFAGFNVNYYDNVYLDIYPDRRSAEAVAGLDKETPLWNKIIDQEEFDAQFTADIYGGKSWKIDKYYLAVNLSVNNLLNNEDFIIGGFEQYRFDPENIDLFKPKYFYLYGTTYYLNVSFRF